MLRGAAEKSGIARMARRWGLSRGVERLSFYVGPGHV